MNGILKDTNLSSNGYNSSSFGLSGNPILLAMDSLGILCCLIEPSINSLPRTFDKSGTISVKLKKKLSYKSCDFSENVRPMAVICALHRLMNESDLHKNSGITIDEKWIEELDEENINENYDLSDNIHRI
jgi:hypothetical protein